MLKQIEGFVLRSVDYGETSKVITLFSREWGKVAGLARGAKKSNRPLHAATQLGTLGSFLMYKQTGMGTIQQAEVIQSFRKIREDLLKTAYAAYVMELTDKLLEDEIAHPEVYENFYHFFNQLQNGYDPEILVVIFEMKMLRVAGIMPQVKACAHCGQSKGLFQFSIREAGFLCRDCRMNDFKSIPMSPLTTKLLSIFPRIDFATLTPMEIPEETKKEIKMVIHLYYQEYAGLYLKTRKFLDDMTLLEKDL